MPRLRVMRRAHDIAVQILPQNVRILPLHSPGHGLADEWKRLVPVQPPQLDHLAVQRESMIRKDGFSEANPPRILVDAAPTAKQLYVDRIQLWVFEVP